MLEPWPAHRRQYAMHLYWNRGSIWGGGSCVCCTFPGMPGLPAWLPYHKLKKNLKWDIDLKKKVKVSQSTTSQHCRPTRLYLVFQNECDYYIAISLCSSRKMACIENVNVCENCIQANCKQCMMQMPVRTAEQLDHDYSHLVLQGICDSVLWNDPVFIMKWPSH